jgi:hypothetical protein
MAAVAGWQNLAAVDAGIQVMGLLLGHGEGASGGRKDGKDGGELHLDVGND